MAAGGGNPTAEQALVIVEELSLVSRGLAKSLLMLRISKRKWYLSVEMNSVVCNFLLP